MGQRLRRRTRGDPVRTWDDVLVAYGSTDLFSRLFGPGPTKETPMTTQFRLDLRYHGLDVATVLEAIDAVRQLGLRVCAEWHEIDEGDPTGPGRPTASYWRPCHADEIECQIRDAARPVDRQVRVGDRIMLPLPPGPDSRLTPVTVSATNGPAATARWVVVDVPNLIDGAELPGVRPGPFYAEVPDDAVWTLVDDVGTVRPVEIIPNPS